MSAKRGWLLRQIQYNSHKLPYILTLCSRGRGGGGGASDTFRGGGLVDGGLASMGQAALAVICGTSAF